MVLQALGRWAWIILGLTVHRVVKIEQLGVAVLIILTILEPGIVLYYSETNYIFIMRLLFIGCF